MEMIGLTGGIASGKSTVARFLQECGIATIDADEVARAVVQPGTPGLMAIVREFGAELLTPEGELDRPKMAAIVFANQDRRHILNSLLHPLVGQETARRTQEIAKTGARWIIYEVPLLFENDLEAMMFKTILVALPESTQMARLCARDNLSQVEASQRIASQMSLAEKRERADYIIENDDTIPSTIQQIKDVWFQLTGDKLGHARPSTDS